MTNSIKTRVKIDKEELLYVEDIPVQIMASTHYAAGTAGGHSV